MCWSAAWPRVGATGCKTVGFAFGGSNPPPATSCGNGPLAADLRLRGPFLLRPAGCHVVALWTAGLRCPRTYSGRRPATRTVGFHGRPRTKAASTDEPRTGAACGLASVAERSVQVSAHGCQGQGACTGIPARKVTYRRPGAGSTEMIARLVAAPGCAPVAVYLSGTCGVPGRVPGGRGQAHQAQIADLARLAIARDEPCAVRRRPSSGWPGWVEYSLIPASCCPSALGPT
jgi:hypothetical protein